MAPRHTSARFAAIAKAIIWRRYQLFGAIAFVVGPVGSQARGANPPLTRIGKY